MAQETFASVDALVRDTITSHIWYSDGVPPSPIMENRISAGVQIPAPEILGRTIRHTYQTIPLGHRNKRFKIFGDTPFELQKRFRTPDFSIVESNTTLYEGPHDPGAQYKFSDLTSYYPFDGDTEEEKLKDLSGLGNDLVLIGGASKPTFVEGQYGTAMFPGLASLSGAYTANCLFPNLSQGFSGFSVSSWIATRPLNELTENMLLYGNLDGDSNILVSITADLKIRVDIYSNITEKYLVYCSEFPYMDASHMHHLVVTYHKSLLADGSVGIPIIRIFVDGLERTTSLFQNDVGSPRELVYGGKTFIGENSGLLIDEFRTHGHALTQSEVNTEYQFRLQALLLDDFEGTALVENWWEAIVE